MLNNIYGSFGRARVIIAAAALMACCALQAVAQVGEQRSELRIGVVAGGVGNTVDFDPTIRQNMHFGPTLGVGLKYICEKYYSALCALEVQLNYAETGWKEDILSASGAKLPDTYSRNMHYLQIPMFADLGWGKESGFMFHFKAGPQVGYCFADKGEKSSQWTLNSEGNPDRPNNMYRQYDMDIDHAIDYGIIAGVGMELNTKRAGHYTFDVQYYYGLGDIFGNSKKDVFSRSANQSIYVKLGYFITLKKTK